MKTMSKPVAAVSLLLAALAQPYPALAGAYAPGTVFRDALQDGGKGPEMVALPTGSFRLFRFCLSHSHNSSICQLAL